MTRGLQEAGEPGTRPSPQRGATHDGVAAAPRPLDDLDAVPAMPSGLLGGLVGRHSTVGTAGETLEPLGALPALRMPRPNGLLVHTPRRAEGRLLAHARPARGAREGDDQRRSGALTLKTQKVPVPRYREDGDLGCRRISQLTDVGTSHSCAFPPASTTHRSTAAPQSAFRRQGRGRRRS